ncbi:MAG: AMP-binding protein [Pseudomonadota bacterium]
MTDGFDALEKRDPATRAAEQFGRIRALIADAKAAAPGWAALLAEVDPASVTDLSTLPVLRKSELGEKQRSAPPLGGLSVRPASDYDQLFQSPGPLYEPGMSSARDWWRFGRALWAAGIRPSDVVLNCFAYHLTPAGHMLEAGAKAVGCPVIPGGVGNSEAQMRAAVDLGATAYVGTPDFLKVLLDKTVEAGESLAITRALVSGGPLFPSLRGDYADRGIACLQCYGTADLGLIAYETMPDQPMVVDEGVVLEIVRPGTGDPVPEGEVGEVVVTTLNPDYPLFRFATGDLSAIAEGMCPSGRTGPRIKGWMGRADQTTKVKGMFVRPEQIAEILSRHQGLAKARLTVTRSAEQDTMSLQVETADTTVAGPLAESMRAVLKLRGTVSVVPPGSLPNDGKVIEDARSYD